MTTIYLIRHGTNDWVPRGLAGRTPGTKLNKEGQAQAQLLAAKLEKAGIDFIVSSPLERAIETAEPLAKLLGAKVRIEESLIEINFGEWTGKSWEELAKSSEWKTYNTFRSFTRIPGGELMIEAQYRVIRLIEQLTLEHKGKTLALFCHGDVIRCALTYYLGMPIEFFQRLEISPASYSIVQLHQDAPKVICINNTVSD